MDTSSPIPIIKAILPKVPLMGKTALTHSLGLSENSKHWDLRTALTVNVLRSFIKDSPPEPISKVQRFVYFHAKFYVFSYTISNTISRLICDLRGLNT